MAQTHKPDYASLSPEESLEILGRNHVGRLAFSFHDRVDIEPISYVLSDGYLNGRTSEGAKLTTLKHHPFVAFEVDEVRSRHDWESVVAHGTLYLVDPVRDREAYEKTLAAIRMADPAALTPDDTVPYRTMLFRMFVDEVVGRRAV